MRADEHNCDYNGNYLTVKLNNFENSQTYNKYTKSKDKMTAEEINNQW